MSRFYEPSKNYEFEKELEHWRVASPDQNANTFKFRVVQEEVGYETEQNRVVDRYEIDILPDPVGASQVHLLHYMPGNTPKEAYSHVCQEIVWRVGRFWGERDERQTAERISKHAKEILNQLDEHRSLDIIDPLYRYLTQTYPGFTEQALIVQESQRPVLSKDDKDLWELRDLGCVDVVDLTTDWHKGALLTNKGQNVQRILRQWNEGK